MNWKWIKMIHEFRLICVIIKEKISAKFLNSKRKRKIQMWEKNCVYLIPKWNWKHLIFEIFFFFVDSFHPKTTFHSKYRYVDIVGRLFIISSEWFGCFIFLCVFVCKKNAFIALRETKGQSRSLFVDRMHELVINP